MSKKITMFLTACFVCAAVVFLWTKPAEAVTIVLDPGHDNVHTGAQGNGLREEYLNLQIALACRNELETYQGVTVYMVRADETCPYGGNAVGSSTNCNARRVEFAASVGANAYISLHNNSSTNTSARGVSVYYPTTNYNAGCGQIGQGLATSVIAQLKLTGLQDRGISTRLSGDNTRYPDGSLADYYGVIRRSKLAGIPAIIVEHAFVSNAYDASAFLNSNGKLWTLGVLDATGIAQYYGLQKKPTLDYTNASVSGSFCNGNQEYVLQARGVLGAGSVSFLVWSANGGQDDIYCYSGIPDANGNWNTVVPLGANHKTEGTYYVDVYANEQVFMRRTTFTVRGPSISSVEILNMNRNNGTFDVKLSSVLSGADVQAVSVQMWRDGSSAKWFEYQRTGDGIYENSFDIKDFDDAYGVYNMHTYVLDKNQILKCVDERQVTINQPDARMEVKGYDNGIVMLAKVENLPFENRIAQVYFDVCPAEQQEQAVRYIGDRGITDSWTTYMYAADLGGAGSYTVRAYEKLDDGTELQVGERVYDVPELDQIVTGAAVENGLLSFDGQQVRMTAESASNMQAVHVRTWSVRETIRQLVGMDKEFVAYELTAVPKASGEAVTSEAVTPEAVMPDTVTREAVTIHIPVTMIGRSLEVYVLTGDGAVLEKVEAVISEDETEVTVYDRTEGTYVLVANEERLEGDVNGDGVRALEDARKALRFALRIEPMSAVFRKYADVDKDDKVTLQDVYFILKSSLKVK